MGDPPGNPGAVSFCFSFTGQLTHFSKLQHSCVLLYPFNLIAAASFLPFDFSVTSFCFRVWKRQLSLFVLSFLLQGAIDSFFLATTWEMYPLRFQVQISRIQRQNKFSSSSFSDVGDWSKLLASEQIKYSAFSRTFLVLGTGQEIHQLKKFNEKP